MSLAVELFQQVPKVHNCAQSVASGAGRDDLKAALAACGGGRAPEGRCGALHAAMMLVPEEKREALRQEFRAATGAETCRELKQERHVPCVECVALGAELAEKYRAE